MLSSREDEAKKSILRNISKSLHFRSVNQSANHAFGRNVAGKTDDPQRRIPVDLGPILETLIGGRRRELSHFKLAFHGNHL